MARASPSCAMMANSLACALLSAASVATRAMVVFSPGRPFAVRVRAAADIDAAAGIDRDERADRVSIAGHRRGRAEPALEIDGGGAEAGAGGSERKRLAGARGGGVAEIAIGRK